MMKSIAASFLGLAIASASGAHAGDFLATFDDLPNGPTAANPALPLNEAVNPPVSGNATYGGVVWDSNFSVASVSYHISDTGPAFGLSHSGQDYLTTATDGVSITTSMVLTEAWFGRCQYYGFSNGTDQVTVNAMHFNQVLASVTLNLPLTDPGQPEPLVRMDTSSFLSLSGITGYTINRDTVDPTYGANNWIGDDFNFVSVPESPSFAVVTAAALALGFSVSRRRGRASL